jgi:uncharacterized protein (TIGR02996 family)
MHTDDSFLLAIEAEPADRVRRLVYADWLDDRHDPRGELVRVEEEMRALPVFADRFWELKPRRNELRAIAGGDWCARMRYGTECEPVFRHGIPDGWRDRWRLIREFTERWHRIPMPDVGGRASDIAEAEASIGQTFPPSLREWIAFGVEVRGLSRTFHTAFGIEPFPFDEHPIVCTHAQYSGSSWSGGGVRFVDLSISDPPIYWAHSDIEGGPTRSQIAISENAFWNVFHGSSDECHRFQRLNAPEYERLVADVCATFPVCVNWADVTIYEMTDVFVAAKGIDDVDELGRVAIKRAHGRTVESLPAFLRPLFPPLLVAYGAPDNFPF